MSKLCQFMRWEICLRQRQPAWTRFWSYPRFHSSVFVILLATTLFVLVLDSVETLAIQYRRAWEWKVCTTRTYSALILDFLFISKSYYDMLFFQMTLDNRTSSRGALLQSLQLSVFVVTVLVFSAMAGSCQTGLWNHTQVGQQTLARQHVFFSDF